MAKNDFGKQLNTFMKKTVPQEADKRIRRIAMACYQRIQEISPVDEGTFRANWLIAFGELKRHFDGKLTSDDIAKKTSEAMMMFASKKGLFKDVFFICNSAPYAIPLEHGYSKQAPAGVVDPVIRLIKAAIEAGRL